MYKEKTILALIPARGGSKGIPRKNIKLLGCRPLIQWTIDEANESRFIDKLFLSSEDNEIIQIAQEAGCEVPFVRPLELAKDTSSSMDVILHALSQLKESYDYLLLLQPTSPFRTVLEIDSMIKKAIDSDSSLMISVSKVKKHPSYLYQIIENKLIPFIETDVQLRRQDMIDTYEHNGSMYLSKIDFLLKYQTYNSIDAEPFETFGASRVDLDSEEDWDYAEYLIKEGKV